MTTSSASIEEVIGAAAALCEEARWDEATAMLDSLLEHERTVLHQAQLKLALVHLCNEQDWALGLRHRERKHALLDEVEQAAEHLPDAVRAEMLFQRGMALHLEFIMAEGDQARELDCFTRAAELFSRSADREGAALATAFVGIFHHVDRLDRDTAEPILRRAYEMSAPNGSHARSEAARHLGQIRQERGDPGGAIGLLEESLRQRAKAGMSRHMVSALHALGFAHLEAGDLDTAQEYLRRARETGERYCSRFFLALIARTEAELEFTRFLGPAARGRSHP